jgi:hypothetical protein
LAAEHANSPPANPARELIKEIKDEVFTREVSEWKYPPSVAKERR